MKLVQILCRLTVSRRNVPYSRDGAKSPGRTDVLGDEVRLDEIGGMPRKPLKRADGALELLVAPYRVFFFAAARAGASIGLRETGRAPFGSERSISPFA